MTFTSLAAALRLMLMSRPRVKPVRGNIALAAADPVTVRNGKQRRSGKYAARSACDYGYLCLNYILMISAINGVLIEILKPAN